MPMQLEQIIEKAQAGQRLDTLVCRTAPGLTRSRAVRLICAAAIRVNQQARKPGYRVREGDRITGQIFRPEPQAAPEPQALPLDIVHEDDHLLVVNKAAGMVVHPGAGVHSDTLVNALLCHAPEMEGCGPDPLRPGIVHRLDKDTSGLVVAAKTAQSLDFLQKEFAQRRVEKQYLALVSGSPDQDRGRIDLPIGRHRTNRKIMAVDAERGRPALTLWQVEERLGNACLVRVRLMTGRTHQIRVHFYHMGHPLVGDRVYQYRRRRKKGTGAGRQMLHSCHLSFRHPWSGVRLWFSAGLPRDFSSILTALKKA